MSRGIQGLLKLARKNASVNIAVVFVAAFAIFMSGIFITHHNRTYNSDDVVVQDILRNWSLNDKPFFSGPQNFVFKIPLYYLIQIALPQDRTALLTTALIQNAVCFSLFIFAIYMLFKNKLPKNPLTALPLLWLASLGIFFYGFLINPNTRNMEIGIVFAFLALFIRYIDDKKITIKGWRWYVALVLGYGIFSLVLFSDPFFIYFFILPFLLVIGMDAVWNGINKRAVHVAGFMILAIGAKVLLNRIFDQLGFIRLEAVGTMFVDIQNIGANLKLTILGYLKLNNADFFRLGAMSLRTVIAFINLGIILGVLIFLIKYFKKAINKREFIPLICLFGIIGSFFIYGFSITPTEIANSRYMILIPFYETVGLVFALTKVYADKRVRNIVLAILSIAVLGNVYMLVAKLNPVYDFSSDRNEGNKQIISILEQNNLSYGYGGYWSAGIHTYLSDNKIRTIPIDCLNGSVIPFNWYANTSLYSRRAEKMFLIDTNRDTRNCVNASNISIFGTLEKTIYLDKDRSILIFDTDSQPLLPWDAAKALAIPEGSK